MVISSHKKMKYILMQSLERMALIQIAIALWNKKDTSLMRWLVSNGLYDRVKKWQLIEDKVLEKVQQLSQPQPIKEKISCFIKPIGIEIREFINDHLDLYEECILIKKRGHRTKQEYCEMYASVNQDEKNAFVNPDEFYWTRQGILNRTKTVEKMIKNGNLDIESRYVLACHYCLEKEIFELWNIMPANLKKNLGNILYVSSNYLLNYWTSYMVGKSDREWSEEYEYLIESSIIFGHIEATKYLFTKIKCRKRKYFEKCVGIAINSISLNLRSNQFICFLLSQLDEDQETKVIEEHEDKKSLLLPFLSWPLQPRFVEIAKRMSDFLLMDESDDIMLEIANQVIKGYKDYDYQALSLEFWQLIPDSHKTFIVKEAADSDNYPKLLLTLLQIKHLDIFYLILKGASAEQCQAIFCNLKRESVEEFPKQIFILSSSKDIVQFAKEFRERILCSRSKEEIEKEKETWNKFFQYVDCYLSTNNKRAMEEVESGASKKFVFAEEDLYKNQIYKT